VPPGAVIRAGAEILNSPRVLAGNTACRQAGPAEDAARNGTQRAFVLFGKSDGCRRAIRGH